MTSYDIPPKEELEYLYLHVGLTREELQEHYFVGKATITRWLHVRGINKYRDKRDKLGRACYVLYVNKFSPKVIADMLDMSRSGVWRIVKKYEKEAQKYGDFIQHG